MKTFLFILYFWCLGNFYALGQTLADDVDMWMGTYGAGHCVIGPQLPHGSVNPSPQTANGGHAGYVPDQPIRGFGQLHVSGTGWGRYGQIFLSPQIGFDARETGHDSSKQDEIATPYYYSVNLIRYGIRTEVTPTYHCAAYRFTFPKSSDSNILLDIAHNIPQHIVPEIKGKFYGGEINYLAKRNLLTGWGKYAGGFGSDVPYKVYFAIAIDSSYIKEVCIKNEGSKGLYAQIRLKNNVDVLHLNIGISMKSIENAFHYLSEEVKGRNFDSLKETAKQIWNTTLGSIKINCSGEEERLFYTALYHSFLMPRDRTGDNPNWNSLQPHLDDHYSIWDTWRTKYPLMVLLHESFVAKTINSFIDRFKHDGVCSPTYTSSLEWNLKQGGDDVDNVIADAMVKGVKGFDYKEAYDLIKWHALTGRSKNYRRIGWEPEVGAKMSCSMEMEYAYNDFCASEVAEIMHDIAMRHMLYKRSCNWKMLFNNQLNSYGYKGFVTPRREDGQWLTVDPAQMYGSWVEYFYEGNSWTYSLFVPHQFDRLVKLCGGKDNMVRRLSYGFDNNLISLNNEPGFLSPFIFMYCGRPDLCAYYISKIRRENYSLKKGYIDNEDSGAMGSWYVFASIGLFPNVGQDIYYLFPPAFSSIELTMENGKKIFIQTRKNVPDAKYIESISVNGKMITRRWISHHEIAGGADIIFNLMDKRNSVIH
jgi:predicted alpha-1,2-mannosidase